MSIIFRTKLDCIRGKSDGSNFHQQILISLRPTSPDGFEMPARGLFIILDRRLNYAGIIFET